MVMISERPAEVEDRAVPGHWEGDLIIGKNSTSAVGTLVERSTRYVMLLAPPRRPGRRSRQRGHAQAIATLPAELFRTITWDQGTEMSRHATFTIATGIQVYFCDPHSPVAARIQREHQRAASPVHAQRAPISRCTAAEDLAGFARSLNNRPRKTLGWMKPSEKLAELFALTA